MLGIRIPSRIFKRFFRGACAATQTKNLPLKVCHGTEGTMSNASVLLAVGFEGGAAVFCTRFMGESHGAQFLLVAHLHRQKLNPWESAEGYEGGRSDLVARIT